MHRRALGTGIVAAVLVAGTAVAGSAIATRAAQGAAAPMGATDPAAPKPADDPAFAAIARQIEAHLAHERTCREEPPLDSPCYGQWMRVQARASRLSCELETGLSAVEPTTWAGLAALVEHVAELAGRGEGSIIFDHQDTSAGFLSSIASSVRRIAGLPEAQS